MRNLKELGLHNNHISNISSDILMLQELRLLFLSTNQITTLPSQIWTLRNLIELTLQGNLLTEISPDVGNLTSIDTINLSGNQLTTIPSEIGNLQRLRCLNVSNNQLTTIPAEIGNLNAIRLFIDNNPIEYIPPNVGRLLIEKPQFQGVYTDAQSVHNSTVQQSIKASIMRLLSINPTLKSEDVLASVLSDLILKDFTKQSLVEYSRNTDLISEVNVTFLEVLTAVWNRIINSEHSSDIKGVLNDEMADAECKCFTGRVSRLVNCLSGVDELVEVKIADNEQIGNVISVIGDRLTAEGRYSTSLHKEIAEVELKELGYKKEVVDVWLEYIE